MFPWFWLQFRFPFSGDIAQDIAPETVWDLPFSGPYKGDREMERRILADGAGYGEQLGALHAALAELIATAKAEQKPACASLLAMQERIASLKQARREDAAADARAALEKLRRRDKPAHDALVAEWARKG